MVSDVESDDMTDGDKNLSIYYNNVSEHEDYTACTHGLENKSNI